MLDIVEINWICEYVGLSDWRNVKSNNDCNDKMNE